MIYTLTASDIVSAVEVLPSCEFVRWDFDIKCCDSFDLKIAMNM